MSVYEKLGSMTKADIFCQTTVVSQGNGNRNGCKKDVRESNSSTVVRNTVIYFTGSPLSIVSNLGVMKGHHFKLLIYALE